MKRKTFVIFIFVVIMCLSTKAQSWIPFSANLGEQAILNKEIYAQGANVTDLQSNVVDEQVFGYQERWSEMR